jgi:3-deoxy-D-manno-octulosonic acid kinase
MQIVIKNNKLYSSQGELTSEAYDELDRTINNYPNLKANLGPLMGRSHVHKFETKSLGKLVMKPYRRGGLWSWFNSESYIRSKSTRPEIEYEMLLNVAALGIFVPKPIVAITTQGLLYRGWLVMQDLDEKINLIDLSINSKAELPSAMAKLCTYVRILIENRICHVDLHPGNVIQNNKDELYIIDFDKAYYFKGDLHDLRDYYLCRWRRAVIKHGLSQELIEHFCMGLRHNFNKSTYECSSSVRA